jgi:hypothetical protein
MRRAESLSVTKPLPVAEPLSIAESVPIAEPDADRLRFQRQLG